MSQKSFALKRRYGFTRLALLPWVFALAASSLAYADSSWAPTATQLAILPPASSTCGSLGWPGYWQATGPVGYEAYYNACLAPSLVSPLDPGTSLHVVVSLQLRNLAQLQIFLHDISQPGSAVYAKYLSPSQFMTSYAPTSQQVQAVVGYLQKNGFEHIAVASNHLLINADGLASDISAAFNTSLVHYTQANTFIPTHLYYANTAPAQVPQALSGIVGAVLGLQNIYLQPSNVANDNANYLPAPSDPLSGYGHSPTDYPSLYDAGNTAKGSKTSVAIITAGDMKQTVADLNTFTNMQHLAKVPTSVVEVGTGALGTGTAQNESQVIAGAAGQLAHLTFYSIAPTDSAGLSQGDLVVAYNRAVSDACAKLIDTGWTQPEVLAYNTGAQSADDTLFMAAQAQGQVFIAATGESLTIDTQGYPVLGNPPNEPATSPYLVSIGGSMLLPSTQNGSTTWSEQAWYEMFWTETASGDGSEDIWVPMTGASAYENVPSWQSAVLSHPLPGDPPPPLTNRVVPDVAFDAYKDVPGSVFPGTPPPATSGARIVVNGAEQQLFNGTELSAAIFTGLFARIESAHNNALGLPTPQMYVNFAKDPSPLNILGGGIYGSYTCATTGWTPCAGWGSLDIGKFDAYVTKDWSL